MTIHSTKTSHAKIERKPSFISDASDLRTMVDTAREYAENALIHPSLLEISVVVDVNAIVATLIRKCGNPDFQSSFEELKSSGIITFHIPHWAITELEESAIKQVSEDKGIPIERLFEQWGALKPCFTVHEGYSFPHQKGWVSDKIDWKDEPYAALQKDIGASAVISDNIHDLEGLGAKVVPAYILGNAKTYARAEKACVTTKIGGIFVGHISVEAAISLFKFAPTLWSKAPDALKWGVIAASIFALLHPTTRKKICDGAITAAKATTPMIQEIYKTYQNEKIQTDKSRKELEAVLF